jgi:hypothetical protein
MGGAGMPKGRQLVTCMFCGLTRPTSIEDVIPKWVRYALDPTFGVTVRAEPGNVTARMQHLVVTLHGMVCEACNTGWMHDLEEKVKPFLKPLLVNTHGADLDLTQQRDLARWAVMKVLLMEHVMRQKHSQLRTTVGYVPSEPELAWLMAEACPPPRSRVWLGAFDPQGTYTVKTQARLLKSVPQPGGGNPVASHMTTLTIGSVLLQAFTTNFVLADAQSLPEYDADPPWPYSQALTRIWPAKQQVTHWPPTQYVDPDAFERVVNWSR